MGFDSIYLPIFKNSFGFSWSYFFGIGKTYQKTKYKAKTEVTTSSSFIRNFKLYNKI